MSDNINGKVTNIEIEMVLDEMRERMPLIIESNKNHAKILFEKFHALQQEGFTEEQALQIVCRRQAIE